MNQINRPDWNNIRIEPKEHIYELYHENSKKASLKSMINAAESWKKELVAFTPNGISNSSIEYIEAYLNGLYHAFDQIHNINPIELWIHLPDRLGTDAGLYHMDHELNLRKISEHVCSELHQTEISLLFTGLFEKVTNPLGERGYRQALIRCGQIIQNIQNSCEQQIFLYDNYIDFHVEEYLIIDGVHHSLIEVYTLK